MHIFKIMQVNKIILNKLILTLKIVIVTVRPQKTQCAGFVGSDLVAV